MNADSSRIRDAADSARRPGGVLRAAGEAYEVLGELGYDGNGTAFLARESRTGRLVALRRGRPDGTGTKFDVHYTLDESIPAEIACPGCDEAIRTWARYCPRCSYDFGASSESSGKGPHHSGAPSTRVGDQFEVLGEVPRTDGSAPVLFGRENTTGRIAAFRVERSSSGHSQWYGITQTLRAVKEGEALPLLEPPLTEPSQPEPNTESRPAYLCPVCQTEYPAGTWFCPRDGSSLRSLAATDLVDTVVAGRYRIIEQVGEGAMGCVYRAEHVRMGRICALKIMRPTLKNDPESLGRFGREAAHASRVDHQNVAAVYDFGETDDGMIYLAMEFAEGDPLTDLIEREAPFAVPRAIALTRQIAAALGATHELGIVHRDLKPDNVIVARRNGEEVPKLVDFGVARALASSESRLTRTGFVIGTPRYMSPEQLAGEELDGRSDIYSLGCILLEMLAGREAFDGASAEALVTRRLTEAPPSVRALRPGISDALDRIVTRALAADADARFDTAAALRDALDALPAQENGETEVTPAPASPIALPAARAPRRFDSADGFFGMIRSRLRVLVALALTALAAYALTSANGVQPIDAQDTIEATEPSSPVMRIAAATDSPQATIRPSAGPSGPDASNGTDSRVAAVQPPETGAASVTSPPRNGIGRDSAGSSLAIDRSRPRTAGAATVSAPAVPSLAQIDSVRALHALARQDSDAGEYATAFESFRAARIRLRAMRTAFPTATVIAELEIEHDRLQRAAVTACAEIRRVRIDLGLTPPDCPVGEEGT